MGLFAPYTNARRYLAKLFATYWFEIVYRPGKKNDRADALSRVETEKTDRKDFYKDSLLKLDGRIRWRIWWSKLLSFIYKFCGWLQAGLPTWQDYSRDI